MYDRARRFIIAPDVHGIEQDEKSCHSLLEFARDFRPDIAVQNGDLFDFAALRRGADADERQSTLDEDYDAGTDFADRFFGLAKERHLLLGNHDKRIYDLLDSCDGRLKTLGRQCIEKFEKWADKKKARLYPYDARTGVLQLGHLAVVHGFFTGANACASHSRVYGNCVFGHVHSIESYQTPGLKQQEARAIGCLCKLDMPYINHKTAKLRWANGFAYGFLYPDDTYTLFQARKINDCFHVATEFNVF